MVVPSSAILIFVVMVIISMIMSIFYMITGKLFIIINVWHREFWCLGCAGTLVYVLYRCCDGRNNVKKMTATNIDIRIDVKNWCKAYFECIIVLLAWTKFIYKSVSSRLDRWRETKIVKIAFTFLSFLIRFFSIVATKSVFCSSTGAFLDILGQMGVVVIYEF